MDLVPTNITKRKGQVCETKLLRVRTLILKYKVD